jgi:hypothetical protein
MTVSRRSGPSRRDMAMMGFLPLVGGFVAYPPFTRR